MESQDDYSRAGTTLSPGIQGMRSAKKLPEGGEEEEKRGSWGALAG